MKFFVHISTYYIGADANLSNLITLVESLGCPEGVDILKKEQCRCLIVHVLYIWDMIECYNIYKLKYPLWVLLDKTPPHSLNFSFSIELLCLVYSYMLPCALNWPLIKFNNSFLYIYNDISMCV